jgi:hypothetical protein
MLWKGHLRPRNYRRLLTEIEDTSDQRVQDRMASGIHGLPKVLPGLAMSDPSMFCGWATPNTALRPFLKWPGHRAGGLHPSSTPLDTPRCTGLDETVCNVTIFERKILTLRIRIHRHFRARRPALGWPVLGRSPWVHVESQFFRKIVTFETIVNLLQFSRSRDHMNVRRVSRELETMTKDLNRNLPGEERRLERELKLRREDLNRNS